MTAVVSAIGLRESDEVEGFWDSPFPDDGPEEFSEPKAFGGKGSGGNHNPQGHNQWGNGGRRTAADGENAHPAGGGAKTLEQAGAEWNGKLTKGENAALASYSSQDYVAINSSLRGLPPPKMGKLGAATVDKRVADLDSAITKGAIPAGTVLHRGVSAEFASKLKPGSTFEDKGYVSMTSDKAVAERFTYKTGAVMSIRLSKATPGAILNAGPPPKTIHPREQEIVLGRGSKFKVKSVKNGVIEVELA